MNDKLAKMLRGRAGYRNEGKTPSTMPFPGVARFYKHPVVRTRTAVKKCYVLMVNEWHKVQTKVLKLVVDRWGKGIMEVETVKAGTEAIAWEDAQDENGATVRKPIAFNKYDFTRPKTQMVPVTKPARLTATEPKGVYRALKRLWYKGLLHDLGAAIIAVRAEAANNLGKEAA